MRLILSLLSGLIVTGPALAFSEGDRAAVRSVIEAQIRAFLADDAATAYSFAAPGIKAMFPTEDIFMQMVREGYPPVYRPREYGFAALEEKAGRLEQLVDIVDSQGEFWTARYTLERQPDGSWKIISCTLERKPGEVA